MSSSRQDWFVPQAPRQGLAIDLRGTYPVSYSGSGGTSVDGTCGGSGNRASVRVVIPQNGAVGAQATGGHAVWVDKKDQDKWNKSIVRQEKDKLIIANPDKMPVSFTINFGPEVPHDDTVIGATLGRRVTSAEMNAPLNESKLDVHLHGLDGTLTHSESIFATAELGARGVERVNVGAVVKAHLAFDDAIAPGVTPKLELETKAQGNGDRGSGFGAALSASAELGVDVNGRFLASATAALFGSSSGVSRVMSRATFSTGVGVFVERQTGMCPTCTSSTSKKMKVNVFTFKLNF